MQQKADNAGIDVKYAINVWMKANFTHVEFCKCGCCLFFFFHFSFPCTSYNCRELINKFIIQTLVKDSKEDFTRERLLQ